MTELSIMMDYVKNQIEKTEKGEEQVYLTIISIVQYLQSKPEILLSMDWLKTRKMDLGNEAIKQLTKAIVSIKLKAIHDFDNRVIVKIANWVLFMVVSTLTWWPRVEKGGGEGSKKSNSSSLCITEARRKSMAKEITRIPYECFRVLFRFISLGLESYK